MNWGTYSSVWRGSLKSQKLVVPWTLMARRTAPSPALYEASASGQSPKML